MPATGVGRRQRGRGAMLPPGNIRHNRIAGRAGLGAMRETFLHGKSRHSRAVVNHPPRGRPRRGRVCFPARRGTRLVRRPDRRDAGPSTGPDGARRHGGRRRARRPRVDGLPGPGDRAAAQNRAGTQDRAAPADRAGAEVRAAAETAAGRRSRGVPRVVRRGGHPDGAGGKSFPVFVADRAAMEGTAVGESAGAGAPRRSQDKGLRNPARYPKQRFCYRPFHLNLTPGA